MPSQDEIRMHGVRHCPGGPDPIPADCLRPRLPTIHSDGVNNREIVAGEAYGSGILWGTSAIVNGLADNIFHANDATDGSGDFFIIEDEVVQVFGRPKVISFEFGVEIFGADIDATPPNYLEMWVFVQAINQTGLRGYIWEGEELAIKAAQTSPRFRISGLELMTNFNTYDPDTNHRNINQIQGVIVQECGGAAGDQDVTLTEMWSGFTVLTHIWEIEDIHA